MWRSKTKQNKTIITIYFIAAFILFYFILFYRRNSLRPLTIFLGRLDVTPQRKSCLRQSKLNVCPFYFVSSKHVQRIPLLDDHLSLLWIKYSLKFSVPCPKTPTVILTSVLVLIMRTSLFVNVRTSSLINSVHQIIYYVVRYMAGSDWREYWIVFFFP